LHLRRIIAPQRETLNKLARGDFAVIAADERIFFRDVYDHLVRLYDISEGLRDLVGGALDIYLSVVNNRMNDVMKTLTVITTLFMPVSFLVGFFGTNFFQPVAPLTAWTDLPAFILAIGCYAAHPGRDVSVDAKAGLDVKHLVGCIMISIDAKRRSHDTMSRKIVLWGLVVVLVVFGLIQLVPYGRDHTNPPVQQEPNWDSARTRELADRACFDCHSNKTRWPWYSSVAPVSWLVQRDVNEGRSKFNFSEWGRRRPDGNEMSEVVREGEMPPWFYLPLHSEARLSTAEKDELVRGLQATAGR